MIIPGDRLQNTTAIEADVCIMGGGVAGIVLANELASSQIKIVVIEAGSEDYSVEVQDAYKAEHSTQWYPDPLRSRMRMLGGSSNHWENNTSPLDPIDFEKRSWVEDSGWPISYDDLEPFYRSAGVYVGVADDGYETSYWEKKLGERDLAKNSKVLETGIAKASTPPARFFAMHGQALTTSESVEVYTDAYVVDVEYDTEKQRVSKAFFETKPGLRHSVKAKTFIMCFGGIDNARMMLAFNEKYNDQLGNTFDNVGRYFMDHPVVRAANFFPHQRDQFGFYQGNDLQSRIVLGFFKFRQDVLIEQSLNNLRMPLSSASNYLISDGISSHHILTDSLSNGSIPENFGTHILNYVKDLDMVAEAISRKAFKKPLFDDADEFGGFQVPLMMEQTPNRESRIALGDEKDAFGVRRVNVDWRLNQSDKDQMWRGLEMFANEIGGLALGRVKLLKEREDRLWESQLGYGHHHMGTTRMSNTPEKGVVDANQKVFGTQNFFLGGSSVFPTGGHVPPTLTIVAMSIRLAKMVREEMKYDG